MGMRAYLLVLLCLLGTAAGMAQLSAPPPHPKQPAQGHGMSMAILAAIGVVFCLVFLYLYTTKFRFCLGGDDTPHAGNAAMSRRGLDPAVLATFPIVPYAEIREHKVGGGTLECAVCLTAFEEGDDLRLLPHCSHSFHPECIDPWLAARTTCPLCRANLEKPPPAFSVAIEIPVQENVEDDRKDEAMELDNLRVERRVVRLRRSHSTAMSLILAREQCECDDHERFTLRLPEHVREEVLNRCRASVPGGRCEAGGDGSDCGKADVRP